MLVVAEERLEENRTRNIDKAIVNLYIYIQCCRINESFSLNLRVASSTQFPIDCAAITPTRLRELGKVARISYV